MFCNTYNCWCIPDIDGSGVCDILIYFLIFGVFFCAEVRVITWKDWSRVFDFLIGYIVNLISNHLQCKYRDWIKKIITKSWFYMDNILIKLFKTSKAFFLPFILQKRKLDRFFYHESQPHPILNPECPTRPNNRVYLYLLSRILDWPRFFKFIWGQHDLILDPALIAQPDPNSIPNPKCIDIFYSDLK